MQKDGQQSQTQGQYGYHYNQPNYNPYAQAMHYNAPPVVVVTSYPMQAGLPYPASPLQPYVGPDVPEVHGLQFSTDSIRRGFIRRVYSILLVICNVTHLKHTQRTVRKCRILIVNSLRIQIQLLITLGTILLFMYQPDVIQFAKNNLWLFFAAAIISLTISIPLICCESIRYSWPCNFILLFAFSTAISLQIGFCALYTKAELVNFRQRKKKDKKKIQRIQRNRLLLFFHRCCLLSV